MFDLSSFVLSFLLLAVRQSKFRHLQGSPMHKSLNIENVRNLSKSIPGESDFFHANRTFCAVPLGGSGGLIAILPVSFLLLLLLQKVCEMLVELLFMPYVDWYIEI